MTIEELKQATISQYDDWLDWNGFEGSPLDLLNSDSLNAQQRAYVESVMYILGGE